jgi:hypothetical protein
METDPKLKFPEAFGVGSMIFVQENAPDDDCLEMKYPNPLFVFVTPL